MIKLRWRFLLFAFSLLLSVTALQAQRTDKLPPVTQTYAITNATIITAPGKVIKRGTVLFENGLIQAVGPQVNVPLHAQIISGDSLYVYAGFIAGASHIGIPKPDEKKAAPKVKNPDQPGNERAGIQADREINDLLKLEKRPFAALRKNGFTIAHTVPYGQMLPGQGALVLLADKDADQVIVKNNASLFAQFVNAKGVYPSTIIGITAKWKNLYKNAQLYQQNQLVYTQSANGTQRPNYDRILDSFVPVAEGKRPVYFKTEKLLQAHRAIALQKELGFQLVLTELKEGWDLVELIQSNNLPVFLSTNLPKEKTEETDSVKITPETEKLLQRRKEFYQKYCGQAALFQQKGIRFGFSLLETKPEDFSKNLQTLLEHGLSEEEALAALTVHPAEILGISGTVGTIEKGKIANLLITSGPYFKASPQVKYVFIEGEKYEMDAEEQKPEEDKKPAVEGTWYYETVSGKGLNNGKIILRKEAGQLTGEMSSKYSENATALEKLQVQTNALSFTYTVKVDGQKHPIKVQLTINGLQATGKAEADKLGTFEIKATRLP
ncbi:amidohydrolase family protein [Rapidithrix thailandica]|uniref:Amidohydrolase family protein n=1 Tax=Rapidithrix thailandica TaxID=413964 RepID=A0AAW9S6C4_9BACT